MIAIDPTPSGCRDLTAFLNLCQIVAGDFSDLSPAALLCRMNTLVSETPGFLGRGEQIMVRGILSHMLARLLRVTGICDRPEVIGGFLDLANPGSPMEAWRSQWFHVTESCAALVRDVDTRVTRMLQVIEARYAESTLTMRAVAEGLDVCPSHAARILKQRTRLGFVGHLHRHRIAAARRLLLDRSLSIKEISAAVGYAHHSQLSRHFKLACGQSPAAFRKMTAGRSRSL